VPGQQAGLRGGQDTRRGYGMSRLERLPGGGGATMVGGGGATPGAGRQPGGDADDQQD
jgi:hypothetical protein